LGKRTYGIEDTGTLVMVEVGVQVVDTNRVDAEDLHKSGISEASIDIGKGISA
jgi:hypothetical protein